MSFKRLILTIAALGYAVARPQGGRPARAILSVSPIQGEKENNKGIISTFHLGMNLALRFFH
jgi:hypothetical protein